jgi:pilus assembly protein CpaC
VNQQGGVDFKKETVGPEMTLTPRIVGQTEDVDLDIDFLYKGLAGKQGNAPIVLNHIYKGSLIVKSGESAALVNAMSNVITTQFNKDPPGGPAPQNPLFQLLRSKQFQKQKSQFVVFITPQIIESSSNGTEDIKTKYGLKKKK